MPARRTFALCGAIIAFTLISTAAALAAGTNVTVRVEGTTRTLLSRTVARTHSGSITKGSTPAGVCPSTTAAGALDVATHGRWNGSYSSSLGLSVTQILGETHLFTSDSYWSIWVDNRFAPAGICGLKLHPGEQLLFAAVSSKGSASPIVLSGPSHATAGRHFELKASYFNAKGVSKPLAGARVIGAGLKAVTNGKGIVSIASTHTGRLSFGASETGYIRAAPVTVRIST